jgi:hypothetical protein
LPPARRKLICCPRVHPRYYHFILSVRLGVDGPLRTDLPVPSHETRGVHMAKHKPPTDAEAVIYNALTETISCGPLTWEDGVLSDDEKSEELHWMACHVLASLLNEGFLISRKGA